MCASDSRIPTYLNEAVLRLLPKGKWVGTLARYRICVSAACLSWPRAIETIEAFAICNGPGTVRSGWYEFADFGWGQIHSDYCVGNQLIDRGHAPAFDDITGTNKKIRVYCDLSVDVGKSILLQGYDENGNWILTNNGETNGEEVVLAMPYVDTDNLFTGLTGVQKEVTKGNVRLYELNTSTSAQKPLAIYEPDETLPEYRRSLVPGLTNRGVCCGTDASECEKKTVTVIAKLKFIPVVNETDWVMIGNVPALKDMCQSIQKREDNLITEALAYEASAVRELESELSSFYGDGTVDPIRSMNSGIFSYSGVESLI